MKKVNWNGLWPPSIWDSQNQGQQEFVRQGCFVNWTGTKLVFIHIPKNAGTSVHRKLLSPLFQQGNNSVEYKHTLNSDFFANYFKFAIVRNPWDRMVSCFHYFKYSTRGGFEYNHKTFVNLKDVSFDRFLDELAWDREGNQTNKHWINQDLMTHDMSSQKCWVDYLLRFENLEEDWEEVKKKINLKHNLPMANRSARKKNYHNYYNPRTKKLIEERFKGDIEKFNYSF